MFDIRINNKAYPTPHIKVISAESLIITSQCKIEGGVVFGGARPFLDNFENL